MAVKLVVIYPRPKDIQTKLVATRVLDSPNDSVRQKLDKG